LPQAVQNAASWCLLSGSTTAPRLGVLRCCGDSNTGGGRSVERRRLATVAGGGDTMNALRSGEYGCSTDAAVDGSACFLAGMAATTVVVFDEGDGVTSVRRFAPTRSFEGCAGDMSAWGVPVDSAGLMLRGGATRVGGCPERDTSAAVTAAIIVSTHE
jgi:hypothetical protein